MAGDGREFMSGGGQNERRRAADSSRHRRVTPRSGAGLSPRSLVVVVDDDDDDKSYPRTRLRRTAKDVSSKAEIAHKGYLLGADYGWHVALDFKQYSVVLLAVQLAFTSDKRKSLR